jgi:chromosome segregation ATPase
MDEIKDREDRIQRLRDDMSVIQGHIRTLKKEITRIQDTIQRLKRRDGVSQEEEEEDEPTETKPSIPQARLDRIEAYNQRRLEETRAEKEKFSTFIQVYKDEIVDLIQAYVPKRTYKETPLEITTTSRGVSQVSRHQREIWGILPGVKGRVTTRTQVAPSFIMSYSGLVISSRILGIDVHDLSFEDPRDASDVLKRILELYEEYKRM